jgi:heptose-I-phosphate ethanolaminephosphotransferase
MKSKEIGKYALLAFVAMALIYVWFAIAGVTDLGNWTHGLRNILTGVIFVFLAQLVTGRSLNHPSWWPGIVIFYFWLAALSYIEVKSGGTWGVRLEALNNDVLSLISALVFIFLLEYIGSRDSHMRAILGLFNFLLIGYLSFSIFVYISYYWIFGAGFTSNDMISVLLTNKQEALEFLQSHMGLGVLALVLAIFIIYMLLVGFLIYVGSRKEENLKPLPHTLACKIITGVLLIASLVTMNHCIPRIFPAWPYRVAHKYLADAKAAMVHHDDNLKKLYFTGSTPETLPGSVIVVIGESANRNHLKAFNSDYPAETTPWLSSEKNNPDFYLLRNTYSCYPLTEKALSMYLTNLNQYNELNRDEMITITDIANKAGYNTCFISNQAPAPGNMALELVSGASKKRFTTPHPGGDDMKVMDYLKILPKVGSNFIVIHLEGSHDRYRDRIPPDFEGIHIDGHSIKENDYDSSIMYTDNVLKNIYQYAKDNMNLQAMVYCADHGEDMKSFHGDGYFTWDMIRTPGFVYLSPEYKMGHLSVANHLKANEGQVFTNDLIFDMVCGIMGAENTAYSQTYDITSAQYDLSWENAVSKFGHVRVKDDPFHVKDYSQALTNKE